MAKLTKRTVDTTEIRSKRRHIIERARVKIASVDHPEK